MLCICHPKEAFQIMLVFFLIVILRKHSCWYFFFLLFTFICRQNCNMLCICHPKEAFQIMLVFFSCYSYSFADKIVICCVYVTLRKHFRSCWSFFFLLFICRQNCNVLCICHPKEAFQIMLVFFSCYSYSFADKIVICCVYVTLRKHFSSCWLFFLLCKFIRRQNCNMLCICHPKEAFQIMFILLFIFAGKIVICCVVKEAFQISSYFFFLLFIFAGKIVICCVYVTLRKHFRSCWYFFLLVIHICRQNCNVLCICHPKEAFQIMLVFFSCYSHSFADKIVICCVYVTLRKHFRSCWYFFFLLFRQNCNLQDKIVICCVYVTLRKHFRSCWYFFSCYSHSFADKIVICCVYVTLRKHFRSCWYFFSCYSYSQAKL